ncbi:helix-turn-helix domain-containing protein [Streptomyces sp. YS-3]|uniref:helix-turn-helix domain-containing protein n=1 Tax=Streptomyces sp. YS-3 TaxID=3381352 RepID=UPI0038626BFA
MSRRRSAGGTGSLGRGAGLDDRPRSGRPPVYGPEVRLRVVAAATSTPPHPYGGWSHRLIAAHVADTGIRISPPPRSDACRPSCSSSRIGSAAG